MSDITMKQRIQAFGVKRILNYLDANPDENIPKVLDWVEKFDKDRTLWKTARCRP